MKDSAHSEAQKKEMKLGTRQYMMVPNGNSVFINTQQSTAQIHELLAMVPDLWRDIEVIGIWYLMGT